jgi:hypothetical protein
MVAFKDFAYVVEPIQFDDGADIDGVPMAMIFMEVMEGGSLFGYIKSWRKVICDARITWHHDDHTLLSITTKAVCWGI